MASMYIYVAILELNRWNMTISKHNHKNVNPLENPYFHPIFDLLQDDYGQVYIYIIIYNIHCVYKYRYVIRVPSSKLT